MSLLVFCRGCGKANSEWEKPSSALRSPYCSKDCKRRVQNEIKNERCKVQCRLCGTRLRNSQHRYMAQKRLKLNGSSNETQTLDVRA